MFYLGHSTLYLATGSCAIPNEGRSLRGRGHVSTTQGPGYHGIVHIFYDVVLHRQRGLYVLNIELY